MPYEAANQVGRRNVLRLLRPTRLTQVLTVLAVMLPTMLYMIGVGIVLPQALAGAIGPFPQMASSARRSSDGPLRPTTMWLSAICTAASYLPCSPPARSWARRGWRAFSGWCGSRLGWRRVAVREKCRRWHLCETSQLRPLREKPTFSTEEFSRLFGQGITSTISEAAANAAVAKADAIADLPEHAEHLRHEFLSSLDRDG